MTVPTNILMPALSPTMETGNLVKWLVKEGDKVSSGDVIAEIETDKATMEVEAVDEGTVAKIVVPEGTADVPVNDVIAVLAGEGEDASAAAASPPKQKEAKAEAGKAEQPKAEQPKAEAKPPETPKEDSRQAAPAAAIAPKRNGDGRVFASPLARRLAKENRVDIAALSGSGPHGRIVLRDIEGALKTVAGKAAPSAPAAAPGAAALPQGMSDAQIRALYSEGSYELVPHDSMRKIIARRLVEAKTTIPHFYLTVDCRIDKLLALRADINAAAPVTKSEKGDVPAYKVSVNDLVIKALAMALMAVPETNVTWTEAGMLKHRQADVGVAVAIPGGLITPVVRNADKKTLSQISNEMKDLAGRARNRRLKPEEYQGGATAVSNLGMFGVKDFAAVINPPHATILAVGVGEERAIVENGEIKIANLMTVTMSTDHRAVDGALGAQLLAVFKRNIEAPAGMLA
jgi:pyruvate dehydrogenase E2 component (dihydrolipoamide acetyltransferase)